MNHKLKNKQAVEPLFYFHDLVGIQPIKAIHTDLRFVGR